MFKDFAELIMATDRDIKSLQEATKEVIANTMQKRDDKYQPMYEFWKEVYRLQCQGGLREDVLYTLPCTYDNLDVKVWVYQARIELGVYRNGDWLRWYTLSANYESTVTAYIPNDFNNRDKAFLKTFIDDLCDHWDEYQPALEREVMDKITKAMADKVRKAQADLNNAITKNKEA